VSEPVPTPEDVDGLVEILMLSVSCDRARLSDFIARVRAEEREACARVLDARAEHHERVARETRDDISEDYAAEARGGAKAIRAAIRARRSDP
jgi:hypothetical protein